MGSKERLQARLKFMENWDKQFIQLNNMNEQEMYEFDEEYEIWVKEQFENSSDHKQRFINVEDEIIFTN